MISEIIDQNDYENLQVLKWAQGNLLSVFYSIRKEKIPVISKTRYVYSLCNVALNKINNENMMIALMCIKKIRNLSEKCNFLIEKFFSKKKVNIDKILEIMREKKETKLQIARDKHSSPSEIRKIENDEEDIIAQDEKNYFRITTELDKTGDFKHELGNIREIGKLCDVCFTFTTY